MRRAVWIVAILGLSLEATAGCGSAGDPPRFTPARADESPRADAPADQTAPARNIKMH